MVPLSLLVNSGALIGTDTRKPLNVPNSELYPGPAHYDPLLPTGVKVNFTKGDRSMKIVQNDLPSPFSYNLPSTVGQLN